MHGLWPHGKPVQWPAGANTIISLIVVVAVAVVGCLPLLSQ